MQRQWVRVGNTIINLDQVTKFEISEVDKDTVHIYYAASTADNGDVWSEPFRGHEGRDLMAWLERELISVDVVGWSTIKTG